MRAIALFGPAFFWTMLAADVEANPPDGTTLYVAGDGNDQNSGTSDRPLATLGAARDRLRSEQPDRRGPKTVVVRGGTYYLPETLVFTAEDSGTADAPIVYRAADGETPIISGGVKLDLDWQPHEGGIWMARTPAGLVSDQLFFNGQRQPMARYPNFDPDVRPYNGFAADAFSPQRAARWSAPDGGYIHAMHRAHWGGYHYRITGKEPDQTVTYEGGWQNNRQMGMHPEHRYVENIREELDAPGEWFHDAPTSTLYFYPPFDLASAASPVSAGDAVSGSAGALPAGTRLNAATIELVRLRQLVEFRGAPGLPVRHLTLHGFTFRHAARTFMETREPLLRSDWTIYRGGAVLFAGAEDCGLCDCEFDQVGGNSVFVNNYNRRVFVRGCYIHDSGGNGVALVGDPRAVRNPLFEYGQRQDYAAIDKTPGPQTDNYPADCTLEDCLITRIGRVEKQAAGVQISMAQGITLRHCSIYEVPRAGINISEGTFGGHLVEFCDVFDTVLETGDHGSFNSWGRDRFWGLQDAPAEELPQLALLDVVRPNILRNSRWRCDHGWDIDLDDGSSNYQIYNNLLLNGGLKLREGFHRTAYNNITVNNSLHPHVWYDNSGDVVKGNIFMGAYRPAGGMPAGKWGREIDGNLFTTSDADRTRFAAHDCDAHSLVGDPLFVDPASGDYRVREGSPALQIGFQNFPMDQFGVQKAELKAIARTPELPVAGAAGGGMPEQPRLPTFWLQARVRDISGEEYSAYGVSRESGGVHLADVPAGSPAARSGFQTNDLIQGVNGQPVRGLSDLLRQRDAATGQPLAVTIVRAQQPLVVTIEAYPFVLAESGAETEFKTVRLANAADLVPIQAVVTRPKTVNEPPKTLSDGKLAADYGPVFPNGIELGLYKVDLGTVQDVGAISTWSYNQNDNRGSQRYALFGSSAGEDPGWDVADARRFTPIAQVDSRAENRYHATRVQSSSGKSLGSYRWLIWAVGPVTEIGENTAFQEFQVRPSAIARN